MSTTRLSPAKTPRAIVWGVAIGNCKASQGKRQARADDSAAATAAHCDWYCRSNGQRFVDHQLTSGQRDRGIRQIAGKVDGVTAVCANCLAQAARYRHCC